MAEGELPEVGDLQIDEDERFDRRSGRVQRVAWVVFALVLAAALLGAFGNGWLSTQRARSADGALEVEYERFVRFQSPTEIELRVAAAPDGPVRLWIDRAWLERLQPDLVVPEPESRELGRDGLVMVFRPLRPGEPIVVTLRLQVERLGTAEASIGLLAEGQTAPASPVAIRQFVLP
jgi:hypothetical protein